MQLLSGTPLLMQQIRALGKKNMWLAGRNKKALFQLFFLSFFFIFLMFAVEKMTTAINKAAESFRDIPDPAYSLLSQAIPPCEEFSVARPCYDFVWSGKSTPRIQRIVDGIMAKNPGRPIPPSKVKSFKTQTETNAWFLSDPARTPGALHLTDQSSSVISYGIQPNTSAQYIVPFEQTFLKFQLPLQTAAEREIARILLKDQDFNWTVGMKPFAHAAAANGFNSQLFTIFGSLCLLLITSQVFQNQLSSLVIEKEQKLRQAMNIMGLYDSAYWLSWLAWESILTFLVSLFTIIVGFCFRFHFFTRNNFIVLFLAIYLNLLSMTSIAFLASTLLSQSRSANQATTYVVFGSIALQLMATPFKDKLAIKIIKNILPVIPFNNAVNMLVKSANSENHGMSWKGRNNCPTTQGQSLGNEQVCPFTMDGIYLRLIGSFFLWLMVALYLDNILPSENGIPKSPLYFLNPGYWTGQGGCEALESSIFGCTKWIPKPETTTPDDEDVLEEENKIKKMMNDGAVDPDVAVQIRGLIKTYPGKLNKKLKISPPFHSVKGLWVNFPKDQLFCLLGHNGAGKTTTISCLTGITEVSGGDALIYDHSVRSSVGMSNIRKIIGVCPQFDILWDVLSGEEHLELFSSIKGLPPDAIPTIVHKLLEDVQLGKSAKVRSGSYSGGMRRRLSVAAALIGDPKLVILDEPTTGMDPLTRRHVWDIIESSKRGRAIVLTTHSMEEADVLSDRIGIMAKGKLRCIGTPIRLKMRFGTGFVAYMNFDKKAGETGNNSREELKKLFKKQLDIEPMEENKAYTTYVIPHEKEPLLKKTFGEVQDRQSEFGITDIQLGLATLEEVFLNIAKQEEMESGAAERRKVTLSLTSGTSIQIPVGARFIGIPGTQSTENPQGTMVEVYWGQDNSDIPDILGHSPEKPIPPSLNLTLPKSTTEKLEGVVIDSKQVSDESFS